MPRRVESVALNEAIAKPHVQRTFYNDGGGGWRDERREAEYSKEAESKEKQYFLKHED